MKVYLKGLFDKFFIFGLGYAIRRITMGCENVVDIGCGDYSPVRKLEVFSIGFDIFKPHLKMAMDRKTHSCYILGDVKRFPLKKIGCAVLIEVLEHLEKDDGMNIIKRLSGVSKRILLTTPNGFVEQGECDKNPYQKHLSGWNRRELENLGLRVMGLGGMKCIINKVRSRFGKLVFNILTQPIAYFLPDRAATLMAFYDSKQ